MFILSATTTSPVCFARFEQEHHRENLPIHCRDALSRGRAGAQEQILDRICWCAIHFLWTSTGCARDDEQLHWAPHSDMPYVQELPDSRVEARMGEFCC